MSSQMESCSLHFHSTEDFVELRYVPQNTLLIADEAVVFTEIDSASALGTLLGLTLAEEAAFRAIATARLLNQKASNFDTSFANESSIRRVVCAVLPRNASRHNAPSRSHAVFDLVKEHARGDENLVIVLLPSKREYIFAQACAASRAFPLYSKKSAAHSRERRIDIVLDFKLFDPVKDRGRIQNIAHVANGIRLCQRLVDAPPNVLHSDRYVEECREVARAIGCQCHVIQGRDLEARGFGGIWGVGKASEHLPALVVLSHVPAHCDATSTKSICLVGKGIIYDTGGLSIKDKTGMPGMKADMGGSAAVLGAFQAAVLSAVDLPVHALLCIAENSVGPLATRPDDVHVFYSGKTVEINNTDAEGRLVLADGCAYAAKHLNPKVIVDIATLTGAQGIATGKKHAALYCNDEWLEELAVRVGRESGDLTHPLPYCPEFFKLEFSSAVADMKNSVKDRNNAQASCAGQFIGNHIEVILG
jgi:probable aminopeptidase NPEPL1